MLALALVTGLLDVEAMDRPARQELSPIDPWWLSGVNYAELVLIPAVSMALVIGGNYLNPREAGWGGMAGGLTLALFDAIHPALVWAVYLMIYNTCVGQYYALGHRLVAGNQKRFYPMFAGAASLGLPIGFVGFEELMANVDPVLGYLGLILAAVLVVGYLRDRPNSEAEPERRIQIRALLTKRVHPEKTFAQTHARELRTLVEESPVEDAEMLETDAEEVVTELNADDRVDYQIPEDIRDLSRMMTRAAAGLDGAGTTGRVQ